jgi:PAS domain-containing protein
LPIPYGDTDDNDSNNAKKEDRVISSSNHQAVAASALSALQTLNQPIVVVDSAGNIQWFNHSFSALLAQTADTIKSQSLVELLRVRSCNTEALVQLTETFKGLKAVDIQLKMHTGLGVPSAFCMNVAPLNAESQVASEFCISFADTSEVHSLRASVERTRQLNSVLFECVNAGMGEWRLSERLISLGPRLAVMIGNDPSAWVKRPVKDLFARCHPEDAPFLRLQVEELIDRKLERLHTEFRVKHEEGYWVAFLARGQVVGRDSSGAAQTVSFVFIDVTELRHHDSRWKHRAQLSSDWFWATDEKGNLSEMSKEVAELVNCKIEDLLEKPLLEVLRLTGATPLEPVDIAQFGTKKVIKGRLVRVDRPGAASAWFELDATPRYDFRGEFIGYEGVGRNVTKRHLQELEVLEAKQLAEHSNKSKSVFLATMSHEIRTPMNGVLGMAEMLSTTTLDEEQSESVTIIRQSATHLLSLIDSILDFSKLEAVTGRDCEKR